MKSPLTAFRQVRDDSCHYDSVLGILLTHTALGGLSGVTLKPFTAAPIPATDPDAIGVLGRGSSLRRAKRLSFLDSFLTANFRSSDIDAAGIECLLKDSTIRCFGASCEPLLRIGDLVRYDVVEYCVTNGPSERTYSKPERVGLRVRHLRDEFLDLLEDRFDGALPGTGLTALAYAAHEFDTDAVFVAGFDFYEADYASMTLSDAYDQQGDPTLSETEWIEKHATQKEMFVSIAELCTETDFYVLTEAEFAPPVGNVTTFGPNDTISTNELRRRAGFEKDLQ